MYCVKPWPPATKPRGKKMDGYDWCIKISRMPGVFSGLKVQKSLFKLKKLRRSNLTWPITSTGLNVTFPLLLLTVAWMHGKEAVDFFLPLKASFCHKWKKAEIRTRLLLFIYLFPPYSTCPTPPNLKLLQEQRFKMSK